MSPHAGIPQTACVGGGSLSVRTRINQIHNSAIPNDWSVRTLGDIGQCLIGLTYDPKNISANGVLVLRSSNIDNNTLQFGDDIYVEMDIPERINVREGDLLICVRNGSRPLIGKCALIERQAAGMTFGAFMSVFRSNDSRFVSYCFQSDIVKRQIHKHLGATINQITNKSLNSFEIPYPGSRERTAIAQALSDVDELLAALERLIDKKRAIKQAAMQQLLTGETRLPGFSGEWKRTRIGDIGVTYGGLSGKSKGDFGTGTAHYVSFLGVLENVIVEARHTESVHVAAGESQNLVLRNDLLFNGTSETPGDLAMGAVMGAQLDGVYLNSFCFGLRISDQDRTIPLFLAFFFRGPVGRALTGTLAQGATRYNMSKSQFLNLELCLPMHDEQRAIASVLSDIDAETAALERRRHKTRAIKQGMMQALLTGRLRLVEPEPDSEQEARTVVSYREGVEA